MPILESLVALGPPLHLDDDGVLRVGGTRVRFDSVVGAFNGGSAPEEILFKYPSLNLTDIYAAITYYLWHQDEVEHYLDGRRAVEEQVRRENEARLPRQGLREKLLARLRCRSGLPT